MRREELNKLYHPEEEGCWEILGEDPNCDLGGYHNQPCLGIVLGTYKNVVNYALTLPSFFSWGGGGIIRRVSYRNGINVDKIFDAPKTKKSKVVKEIGLLILEKDKLEEVVRNSKIRLEEIENQLKMLRKSSV